MLNNQAHVACEIFKSRYPNFEPNIAIILGSGLGVLAEKIENPVVIPYSDLPGFPISTVQGHAGELVAGYLEGLPVVCMRGRGHFYEGKGMSVMTSAVRTFKLMGCESMLLTCAAGSLRPEVGPGELVVLNDHINTMPGTPLVGPNDDRFGPRFVSLANAYDRDLRAKLKTAAEESQVVWHEGVYVSYGGPCFETVAEIKMMQIIGGDVVGQSIVPEVISARHCGLKVAAIATITNLAEGLSDVELSHEQTLKYAAIGSKGLTRLILNYLRALKAGTAVTA